jgi:hypothetical protein
MPYSDLSQRKKKLLADGALHRANMMMARADIAAGIQPGALAKDALGHFSSAAKVLLLNTLRGAAANPGKLSPLLITGLSLLSKKAVRKPLMIAGIAGGAIAGAIYLSKLFRGSDVNRNDAGDR